MLAPNVHVARDAAAHAPPQGAIPPHAVRIPWGWPDVTAEQVPRVAVRSQASHCPEHAVSQQ